jgi:hypothetical protein
MVMSHPQSGATQKYWTRLKIVIGEKAYKFIVWITNWKEKRSFPNKILRIGSFNVTPVGYLSSQWHFNNIIRPGYLTNFPFYPDPELGAAFG